jgi:hypothetical protein
MSDTTIFAWTEPCSDYPAYINIKRAEDGKCYITVRSRGNGGRDQARIEVSPQVLESLQCGLCEWLYRDDADRLMAATEAEIDAELRRLGIDPDDAARRGQQAVERALETIRANKAGSAIPGVDSSEKGLGVCPTSRATLLEIEPNGRETEDSNRSAGEEEQRGGEARRCDAARAGSAELGSRSGNAVQHEVATAPGPSAPAAPPDATRAGWWCPQCRREVLPAEVTYQETHDPRAGGCGHPVGAAPVEVVRGIPRPQDMKTAGSAIDGVALDRRASDETRNGGQHG